MGLPVEVGMCDEGYGVPDFVKRLHDATALSGVVAGVQPEIEQRELELPQHRQRLPKMATGIQLVEKRPRQRFAGLMM